jgi:alginate O-acetyltransferase complex protein AlgI
VYKGKQRAERHFGIYALYVMFFPQLVAGPIERPQNLLHQFRIQHQFEYARAVSGLRLILWGMVKKVVIADRLAPIVNQVFQNPLQHDGLACGLATLFFALQIYCDFSGYSDIARGAARVLGFNLMLNFNRPYLSKSISEFWKRWHISLSSWFRDYLYIPLGGNRTRTQWRWYFNLFITFVISGFWHGANWTFVIWGGLNGFYLLSSIILAPVRNTIAKTIRLDRWPVFRSIIQTLITFSLICFSWIFFRAPSLGDALYIAGRVIEYPIRLLGQLAVLNFSGVLQALSGSIARCDFAWDAVFIAIFALVLLEVTQSLKVQGHLRRFMERRFVVLRWGFYYGLVLLVLLYGSFGQQKFIYFQF